MKLDILSHTVTAAVLVALAITLGVWLTRAPLTASPPAAPVKIVHEPTLAPPPPPKVTPTVIEVPVEVEIAATEPPAAEAKAESRPTYQPRHRDLFRRR
jgi:hypothetical protein